MSTPVRPTIEDILAAAPVLAPHISAERLAEIAPEVVGVLESIARLDDLDLSGYEPCLTLSLSPEE